MEKGHFVSNIVKHKSMAKQNINLLKKEMSDKK